MLHRITAVAGKGLRHWRWWLAGGGGLLLILLAAAWLMFQRIPTWYRPVELAPEQLQQVRDDLVRTGDGFTERVANSGAPFEYRVTQDQINRWLAARAEIWPAAREWLPPELSNPFVVIRPDGLRVAVTWRSQQVRTVLSALVGLQADEAGIHVRLKSLHCGSLPVPQAIVQEELKSIRLWKPGSRARGQAGPGVLPDPRDLFDGLIFPRVWLWPEPRRVCTIAGLKCEDGVLTVTVVPSVPQPGRR